MDTKPIRFTEEQIIGILREQEAGAKTADVCRKHGVSSGTFYKFIIRPECRASKSDTPLTPRMTASLSMTNCLTRFLSAASTIQGKRFVQSIVCASGNQPHPIAVALYTQAVAVEFDFVKLIRAGGTFVMFGIQNSNTY